MSIDKKILDRLFSKKYTTLLKDDGSHLPVLLGKKVCLSCECLGIDLLWVIEHEVQCVSKHVEDTLVPRCGIPYVVIGQLGCASCPVSRELVEHFLKLFL